MAAPTFVAEYETVVNTTTSPKTVSVTTAVGDLLVVFGVAENRLVTLGTPSGGTGSWGAVVQEVTATPTADWCSTLVWGKIATAAETFTLSVTRTGDTGQFWGWICIRISGSAGFGVSGKANASGAAPSLALSCSAESMLLCAVADWNALATSRTWRTINSSVGTEQMYVNVSGRYTAYANRWNDVGTAGSKTVGLSAPSTQKYSMVAIEILGSSGATTVTPTGIASGQALGTPAISGAVTVSPSGIGTGAALGAPVVTRNVTVSPAGIATGAAVGTPALTVPTTAGPTGVASGAALGTPVVSGAVTVAPAGIGTGQALGAPTVTRNVTVSPGGISSGTALGTPTITTAVTVSPSGIASGAAVGAASISANKTVSPTGIPTGAQLGTPSATTTITASPSGISSGAAVGTVAVTRNVTVAPAGVTSGAALGAPSVTAVAIDSNTPWSLQVDIPWRTLDVEIPRRILEVELPEPRGLDVDIPGGRQLEVSIPALTLEIDIPALTLEIDT